MLTKNGKIGWEILILYAFKVSPLKSVAVPSLEYLFVQRQKNANHEAPFNMPLKMFGITWGALIRGLFCSNLESF